MRGSGGVTRRSLLKLLIASPLIFLGGNVREVSGLEYTSKNCMVIDLTKCIGCGACVVACTLENTRYTGKTIPLGSRTNFYFYNVKGEKIPYHKICMHCEDPVCTYVCPTGATFKTREGPVIVDYSKCINCRYCIFECPFEPNVRYVNEELGAVDKCTWCYHRIVKGLKPACVEACPTNARIFGDLKNPKSEVYKVLNDPSKNVVRVGEESGIGPNLYFVLPEGIKVKDLEVPKIRSPPMISSTLALTFKTLAAPVLELAGLTTVFLGLVHVLRERRRGD